MIDTALPGLQLALDPVEMSRLLGVTVSAAEVVRHKPGRRALVRLATADGPMLAKVHANHLASRRVALLQQLRAAGFTADAADGICVPEPVASFDQWSMWVQRVVPGVGGETVPALAARHAADAAYKLHRAAVPARKIHTIDDELRILGERVAGLDSGVALLDACRSRVEAICDRPLASGVHRDFYPDQLIIDGERIAIIDFDLYCRADPAIDIGNFVAHLTEHAIRVLGDATAMQHAAQACIDRYVELAGERHRAAIGIYADLSLVRLAGLSATLPGRAHTTATLVDLCLQRLSG